MDVKVFNHREKKVCKAVLGAGTAMTGHYFGGSYIQKGLTYQDCKDPVHLVCRFDLLDPRIGIEPRDCRFLCLYYPFMYDGSDLGYRLLSEDRIEIIHQSRTKIVDDFPYEGYPCEFPGIPMQFEEAAYEPHNPDDALKYGSVFGIEGLSEAGIRMLRQMLPDYCDSVPHERLAACCGPTYQGTEGPCPNRQCKNSIVENGMKLIAMITPDERDKETLGFSLWGEAGDRANVLLLQFFCPHCRTFYVCNQID